MAESSLLQRLINNLHGSQEISSQLASYILLGNDSWHTPEIFWTIYPLPTVRQVIAAHQCHQSNYFDSTLSKDSDAEDEIDDDDPSTSEDEVAENPVLTFLRTPVRRSTLQYIGVYMVKTS